MITQEVGIDLTPAPAQTERAIPGTFTVEVETPAHFSGLLPPRQAITYSPVERSFVIREHPHRGVWQADVSGHRVDANPLHWWSLEVTAIEPIEVGAPLGVLNEYGEQESLGVVHRAWMEPETSLPTISAPGERIVWDYFERHLWHAEGGERP